MLALQHEFELRTLPSIQPNGHVVCLLFGETYFLFLFLAESGNNIVRLRASFPSADIFVVQVGIYVRGSFHENKRGWMDFIL
jgi:hypothetical protein